MATAQNSIDWYKQRGMDMVMVEDARGNKYLSLRDRAFQDPSGAWRPQGYDTQEATGFAQARTDSAYRDPTTGFAPGSAGYDAARQQLAQRSAFTQAQTDATSRLTQAGMSAGDVARYAPSAAGMYTTGKWTWDDIIGKVGATVLGNQRGQYAEELMKQGMTREQALAAAAQRYAQQETPRSQAISEAVRALTQFTGQGVSIDSLAHWFFYTPQGKAILDKYGLQPGEAGPAAPGVLQDGTGAMGSGQRFVGGRPVSQEDYLTYSRLTQDDLNRNALQRRTQQAQAGAAPVGTQTGTSRAGMVFDEKGDPYIPGATPRLGMAPRVPNTSPQPGAGGVAPVVPDTGAVVAPEPAPAAAPPAEAPGTGAPAGGPAIQPRPMSPEAQAVLDEIKRRMGQPPMTIDELMQSPYYQSQQQAIDLQRGTAQAQLRRAMASRNMLRSTPAVQALASSDAYYTAQEAALVPKMLQAAIDQRQSGLGELHDYYNSLSAADQAAFNRGLSEFTATAPYKYETVTEQNRRAEADRKAEADAAAAERKAALDAEEAAYKRAMDEAEMTGRYISPEARQLIETVLDAKRRYTALIAAGDREGAQKQNLRANAARQQLSAMGVDASMFGADVTLGQAEANVGVAGIQTLKAQRDALDMQIKRLELQIAADPDVGKRAQAEADMAKLILQMEEIDSRIALNTKKLVETASTIGKTEAENSFASIVARAISTGKTADQIKAEIRANPGSLGASVTLARALELVDQVAGIEPAKDPTKAETENPVYLDLSGLKAQGKTYDEALQWLQNNPDKWAQVTASTIDKWLESLWPANIYGKR